MRCSFPLGNGLRAGALLALLVLLPGCSGDADRSGPTEVSTGVLQVRTTCFPVGWLVQRIGGDRIEHVNILPAGEDPPVWQPSGATIAELGDADLIVVNGAGFERWTLTAALPVSKLVDTTEGLELISVERTTHSHGMQGDHSHAGIDPHTWSDPRIYLAQARNVHAALVDADPANREYYDRNIEALAAELEELDREYARVLEPAHGRRLAANHPAYAYFALRYGLDVHSFDFDPHVVPSAEQMQEFSDWAAGDGPRVVFWEAEPLAEVTGAFPGQVRHLFLDSLEQPPTDETYDYLAQARANLGILQIIFSNSGS